ncbi:phosphohistidine phosphatase [Robiginitalea myxolifaciens]|uniref:Phosphohistidine phosphatase n=1 Tax=Robiginitalea myxolifaciens TaxID=400055 RepID=A0A1I6H3T9_9FLAO|nr:histidine phosphatase family protein [Robiginitalea myxolifaciens]SFR49136.1 phosphohistidine phosphatase [Robiginitalea myxolifaciens]
MKELLIIRHAKSSWEYEVSDRDRPLQERGIRDAHRIGAALSAELAPPEAVFSSPANRALHTCMIIMRQLELPLNLLEVTESLYDFGGVGLRTFVKGLDNSLDRVMLFGHNHAITDTANAWGNSYFDNIPTAGFVHLKFETNTWSSITEGLTDRTLFPKALR